MRRGRVVSDGSKETRDRMMGAATGLAGRRVLVIEDEALIAMLLEAALEEMGCEIVGVASCFADALFKAASLTYDVAILDLNLNGEKTIPIAEALKERSVPFVLATG